MDTQQTSDHFADADKMMGALELPRPQPVLNNGDAWDLFETKTLQQWLAFYKRKLGEDQAALREAAMNHLRSRNAFNAIEHELTRRGLLAGKEA